MGSMSVSSFICFMFVSCVHLAAVLNSELGMTCSLLMLVEDASLLLIDLKPSFPSIFCEKLCLVLQMICCCG